MSDEKTNINWMEMRDDLEVSQYQCVKCEEIFYFSSDKDGTDKAPVCCPMCGRVGK